MAAPAVEIINLEITEEELMSMMEVLRKSILVWDGESAKSETKIKLHEKLKEIESIFQATYMCLPHKAKHEEKDKSPKKSKTKRVREEEEEDKSQKKTKTKRVREEEEEDKSQKKSKTKRVREDKDKAGKEKRQRKHKSKKNEAKAKHHAEEEEDEVFKPTSTNKEEEAATALNYDTEDDSDITQVPDMDEVPDMDDY